MRIFLPVTNQGGEMVIEPLGIRPTYRLCLNLVNMVRCLTTDLNLMLKMASTL